MVLRSALTGVIVLVAVVGNAPIFAQRTCYPVLTRETAGRVAKRLTGNPSNRHASWFHFLDHSRMPVAKRDYELIRPGWLACLDEESLESISLNVQASVRDSGSRSVVRLSGPLAGIDPKLVALGPVLVAALALILWVPGYARRRRARLEAMRRFGHAFVREFRRPLTEFRGAGRPLHARFRIRPHRSEVEILLAPAHGASYPNLSDHRANVEYDVARVMRALRQTSFINGRPYAEGEWVVLPFQFSGSVQQGGIR